VAGTDGAEGIDAYLHTLGATTEQIDVARRDHHVAGLAGDLVLSRGATLTAGDLADRAGVGTEEVLSLWRTLGVIAPDDHRPFFTVRDAEFTASMIRSNPSASRESNSCGSSGPR
jgi:hypothetical protein